MWHCIVRSCRYCLHLQTGNVRIHDTINAPGRACAFTESRLLDISVPDPLKGVVDQSRFPFRQLRGYQAISVGVVWNPSRPYTSDMVKRNTPSFSTPSMSLSRLSLHRVLMNL